MFLEQIAGRIERREYGIANAPLLAFWPEVAAGLKFAGLALILNLMALPLYFVAPLFPFVYYSLNSYLLGREFFETVAGRHVGRRAANAFRKQNRTLVLMAGLIIALGATFPLAGLFAPFASVALMVHLYQRMKA